MLEGVLSKRRGAMPLLSYILIISLALTISGCGDTWKSGRKPGIVTTTSITDMLGNEDTTDDVTDEGKPLDYMPVSEDESRQHRAFAEEVWRTDDLTEFIDPVYQIHFYIPQEIGVSISPGGMFRNSGSSISIIDTSYGVDDEFFFATVRITEDQLKKQPSGDYRELDHSDGVIWQLVFPPDYDKSVSSEMRSFVSAYADWVVKTAFVPESVKDSISDR